MKQTNTSRPLEKEEILTINLNNAVESLNKFLNERKAYSYQEGIKQGKAKALKDVDNIAEHIVNPANGQMTIIELRRRLEELK